MLEVIGPSLYHADGAQTFHCLRASKKQTTARALCLRGAYISGQKCFWPKNKQPLSLHVPYSRPSVILATLHMDVHQELKIKDWKNYKNGVSGDSPPAAAARFLAKYSSARAIFLATDGLTHFFLPGNTVNEQPTASSFSFACAEKALHWNVFRYSSFHTFIQWTLTQFKYQKLRNAKAEKVIQQTAGTRTQFKYQKLENSPTKSR
ncbi:hypothetical protein LXL04_024973 [Taraxacum kok-saghyz]